MNSQLLSQLEKWVQDQLVALHSDECSGLEILVPDHALHRIGFVGHRGTGKSTLINRLIGKTILPTDPKYPASAALTEVIGWPDLPRKDFHVFVYFIEEDEWILLVKDAMDEIDAWRSDPTHEGHVGDSLEELTKLNVLIESMLAFEKEFPDIAKWTKVEDDSYVFEKIVKETSSNAINLLPEEFRTLLKGGFLSIVTDSAQAARKAVEPYNVRKLSRWPLVQKISIRGPFELLQKHGFSVIDIPGEGDSDPLLHKHFETGLLMCDKLYYLPQEKQVAGNTTIHDILRLWRSNLSGFCVLVTHAADSEEWEDNAVTSAPWSSLENARGMVRNELLHNAKGASQSFLYRILEKVLIYFVENSPKDSNARERYDEHWRNFLSDLTSSIDHEEKSLLDKYINDVNEAFSILRIAVKSSEAERHRQISLLQTQWNHTNGLINGGFPCCDYFQFLLPNVILLSQSVSWVSEKPHYKTLQTWFNVNNETIARMMVQNIQLQQSEWQNMVNSYENVRTSLKAEILAPFDVSGPFTCLVDAVNRIPSPFNEGLFWRMYFYVVYFLDSQFKNDWIPLLQQGGKMVNNTLFKLQNWYLQNFPTVQARVFSLSFQFLKTEMSKYFQEVCSQLYLAASAINMSLQKNFDALSKIPRAITFEEVSSGHLFSVSVPGFVTPLPEPGRSIDPQRRLLEYIEQSNLLLRKPDEMVIQRLLSFRAKKRGSVYVMRNPTFKENLFKIGLSTLPLATRAKQLYTTGVPANFEVVHDWTVDDVKLMESCMHMIFQSLRVNKRREFFDAPFVVIKAVGDLVAETVRLLSHNSR